LILLANISDNSSESSVQHYTSTTRRIKLAKRALKTRMRYAWTYKPVLDDARCRSFDTMEEYRRSNIVRLRKSSVFLPNMVFDICF
jgi:hypothetical protein